MSTRASSSWSDLVGSVRSRVVAVVVGPSVVFLCAVIGVGWHLAGGAVQERSTAALVGDGIQALAAFDTAVVRERGVSVRGGNDLAAARAATDSAGDAVRDVTARMSAGAPAGVRDSFATLGDAVAAVDRARRDVDGGARDADAARTYAPVVGPLAAVLGVPAAPVADLDVAEDLATAGDLLAAAESIRAADLALATAVPRGLDVPAYRALDTKVGPAVAALRAAVRALPQSRRDAGTALLDGPEWRTFTGDAERLLGAGPRSEPAPARAGTGRTTADAPLLDPNAVDELTAAGDAVAATASDLAFATARDAVALASALATDRRGAIVGVMLGVVALIAVATLAALWAGGRLAGRVRGLRIAAKDTAAALPALLERIRRGETVDLTAELPSAEDRAGEIGEIGAAVAAAQRCAVAAATEEAHLRAGAGAVFRTVAHRSRTILSRQQHVLDEAVRAERDAEQLARLVQVEHLSTRERRNAENLMIMGGRDAAERGRGVAPLAEVIRSAVTAGEQSTRIILGEIPDMPVDGAAVDDLVHLLAELVDNASSFSPPQCPIEVGASVVGRGAAVEIEDRGLGIEPDIRERLNAMLAQTPDGAPPALPEDDRLGMSVVARLARRHGVRVTLLESTYGGVKALVLLPHSVLAAPSAAEPVRGQPGSGVPRGASAPSVPPGRT